MPQTFDAATLASLHDAKEVRIRTGRHRNRGVVIWIVVADDAAFVRSVRGPTGKWFVAAAADGQATPGGRRPPASRASHPGCGSRHIEAVSRAFLTK